MAFQGQLELFLLKIILYPTGYWYKVLINDCLSVWGPITPGKYLGLSNIIYHVHPPTTHTACLNAPTHGRDPLNWIPALLAGTGSRSAVEPAGLSWAWAVLSTELQSAVVTQHSSCIHQCCHSVGQCVGGGVSLWWWDVMLGLPADL